jgi:hypothetical protein
VSTESQARKAIAILSVLENATGVMKKISRLDRRKIRHIDVLSLQLARDRARQSTGGSDGHVSLSVSNSETIEFGHQRLLDELEAENAELRGHVVDLLLQLQGLRDDAG